MTTPISIDNRICRHGHIDRFYAYGNTRRCLDCRREQIARASAKHRLTNPNRREYDQDAQKLHRTLNPLKSSARQRLQRAIFDKRIFRPNACDKCLVVIKVEAHHYDYHRAFNVMWLCKKCHEWLHHAKVGELV